MNKFDDVTAATMPMDWHKEYWMKRGDGFTIIQVMVILLVVGIVLWAAAKALIDRRCSDDPAAALCASRRAAPDK